MPQQAVDEFQAALAALAVRAGLDVATLLSRLDRLSEREAFAFITDAYPQLLDPFLRSSGELTVQWYSEQPAKPVPRGGELFVPEPVPLVSADRLAASARWALTLPDPVVALKGSATRAVFDQSRNTVIVNAGRERVRWARHAQPSACGFCKLLATRGAVYRSQVKALKSHDHCRCLASPIRDGVYDPPAYVEKWSQEYTAARESGAVTPNEIARAMDPGVKASTAGQPVNLDA